MSEEEEKIIRQVKTMLENATPFDMPPSRYNALETMVNLIEKQQKEIEGIKSDLKYVLEQTLGAFEHNWCIDWNFTEIREKYKLGE